VTRRGLASGIAVSGIGFGTLLLPIAATPLIAWVDWRGAWLVFALLILVAGGTAAFFISDSPEDYGALPDGDIVGQGAEVFTGPITGVSLRDAVMSRPFLLFYLSLFVTWGGVSIQFVHLVPYAEDHGLSHSTAVAIFGFVGIGSIAGRVILAIVADRVGRRSLIAAAFGGMAFLQTWLLFATEAWQLSVFGICFRQLLRRHRCAIPGHHCGLFRQPKCQRHHRGTLHRRGLWLVSWPEARGRRLRQRWFVHRSDRDKRGLRMHRRRARHVCGRTALQERA